MQYQRADLTGETYLFTVNLAERKRTLLVDHVDLLRAVIRKVKSMNPFHIDAMVILPDHLHAMQTLSQSDCDYPTRWMLVKAGFSWRIAKGKRCNASRVRKGERGIRQRRYQKHLVRDERGFTSHVDYIHYNPVKHGYVKQASNQPHSSIHRYIALGVVGRNWAVGDLVDEMDEFGERI